MLPKEGKLLPPGRPTAPAGLPYPSVVSVALRAQLGDTHRAIKTVMRWTGASERTVKNWFAGTRGPSGDHLVALVRNSDDVFDAVLRMAERRTVLSAMKVAEARDKLLEIAQSIDALLEKSGSPAAKQADDSLTSPAADPGKSASRK
jgi:hypothetical protein